MTGGIWHILGLTIAPAAAALVLSYGPAGSQAQQPFGQLEDVQFSATLWQALEQADLVGEGAIFAVPYKGAVHKDVLMTLERKVTVGRHTGKVIVKKMYQGEGLTVENVANRPGQNLKIVAVMFKRQGYDPAHDDWFYVRYDAEGKPTVTPEGVPMAGRVPKCISCHRGAPGNDYIFTYTR